MISVLEKSKLKLEVCRFLKIRNHYFPLELFLVIPFIFQFRFQFQINCWKLPRIWNHISFGIEIERALAQTVIVGWVISCVTLVRSLASFDRPKNGIRIRSGLASPLAGGGHVTISALPPHWINPSSLLPLSFPSPLFWLILLIRNSVIKTSAKPPPLPSTRQLSPPFFTAMSLKVYPDH